MSAGSPVQTNVMLAGMAIGGSVISFIGSAAHYMSEKELPKTKAIIRDFIIGAILVLLLLQLIPDSMSSVFSSLPSMSGLMAGGAALLEQAPDMEIQTGVPGF
jgi:hypothetical protein